VTQKGIFDAAAKNEFRTVHEKMGHKVKWSHISLDELAEKRIPVGIWHIRGGGNARRSKWVLDKGAHGRNMAKGKKDAEKVEVEKCKQCGMIDSQRHML
jgi:hypothetical protein